MASLDIKKRLGKEGLKVVQELASTRTVRFSPTCSYHVVLVDFVL